MRAFSTRILVLVVAIWVGHALAQQSAQPKQHSQPRTPAHRPQAPHTPTPAAPAQQQPAPGLAALAQQPPTPGPAQQPLRPEQAVLTQQAPVPSPASPPNQAQTAPPYSADSLYNLANSYARAGKPGLAVLNYKRAALLAPNDPDINANLEYVRATSNVAIEPPTRFTRIAQFVNPTTAAILGVLGIALLGTGPLIHKVTRRYRGLRAASILVGIGFVSLTVCNALLLWPRMREAVILINQTPARVSPVPMGDTAFLLREAETVTISAEHDNFILIRTRTGRTGWVARANLGAVVP